MNITSSLTDRGRSQCISASVHVFVPVNRIPNVCRRSHPPFQQYLDMVSGLDVLSWSTTYMCTNRESFPLLETLTSQAMYEPTWRPPLIHLRMGKIYL